MKQKIDPLATAKSKDRHPVIYEINDSGRQYERNGSDYYNSFAEFIESLGYQVAVEEHPFGNTPGLDINEIGFEVDLSHASYMAQSAYDTSSHVRKPENRYIALKAVPNAYPAIRVQINKEYDANQLKSKIDKAIKAVNEKKRGWAEKELQDAEKLKQIGMHYFNDPTFRRAIEYINIHRGVISFSMHNFFTIKLNDSGQWNASGYIQDMGSAEQVREFCSCMRNRVDSLFVLYHDLRVYNKLPDDLIEWTKGQYHKYFYSATLSSEKEETK